MASVSEIDRARHESIASSGAGFPFLFCFGLTWVGAGALSYVLPAEPAAWVGAVLVIGSLFAKAHAARYTGGGH